MAQMVKNLLAMWEPLIQSLGPCLNPWRREWQPTPVFLSGEFHKQRSLVDGSCMCNFFRKFLWNFNLYVSHLLMWASVSSSTKYREVGRQGMRVREEGLERGELKEVSKELLNSWPPRPLDKSAGRFPWVSLSERWEQSSSYSEETQLDFH